MFLLTTRYCLRIKTSEVHVENQIIALLYNFIVSSKAKTHKLHFIARHYLNIGAETLTIREFQKIIETVWSAKKREFQAIFEIFVVVKTSGMLQVAKFAAWFGWLFTDHGWNWTSFKSGF